MYYLPFFLSLIDDEEASEYFRYLYMKYHEKMFYTALRITHDDMKAEDAVQETFYKLAAKEEQLAWLMTFRYTEKEAFTMVFLCKQTVINMMSKAAERREELSEFSDEDIRSYSGNKNFIVRDQLEGDDEEENWASQKIAWAMNELPPEYSNILMMFFYYKLPIERIMKELNCDKKAVYVKKSRAIKRLKDIYSRADREGRFGDWNAK